MNAKSKYRLTSKKIGIRDGTYLLAFIQHIANQLTVPNGQNPIVDEAMPTDAICSFTVGLLANWIVAVLAHDS